MVDDEGFAPSLVTPCLEPFTPASGVLSYSSPVIFGGPVGTRTLIYDVQSRCNSLYTTSPYTWWELMVTLHELDFLPFRVTDLQSAGRGNSQNGNSTRTLNTVFQTSLSVKCCYQNYIETHYRKLPMHDAVYGIRNVLQYSCWLRLSSGL